MGASLLTLAKSIYYYNESGYSSTGSDSVRTWCCAKYVKSFKRVRPKRLVAFFHSMLFNG